MNEPTYRIKPLVWEAFGKHSSITETIAATYVANDSGVWSDGNIACETDSLEAAKAACEAHYRERIMEGLEEVK